MIFWEPGIFDWKLVSGIQTPEDRGKFETPTSLSNGEWIFLFLASICNDCPNFWFSWILLILICKGELNIWNDKFKVSKRPRNSFEVKLRRDGILTKAILRVDLEIRNVCKLFIEILNKRSLFLEIIYLSLISSYESTTIWLMAVMSMSYKNFTINLIDDHFPFALLGAQFGTSPVRCAFSSFIPDIRVSPNY